MYPPYWVSSKEGTFQKATLLDKTLKILIDMPLLRENGTLTEESGKAIIKIEGNHALFLQ